VGPISRRPRSVLIVCRDREAARRRFGIRENETGICYTRTGRRFFDDPAIERELLERLRSAAEAAGLWERLKTDWLVSAGS
jgi:protein phosphatase